MVQAPVPVPGLFPHLTKGIWHWSRTRGSPPARGQDLGTPWGRWVHRVLLPADTVMVTRGTKRGEGQIPSHGQHQHSH